jgi:hypothetical protein
VIAVLESASVETRKESDEIRVELSVAGTDVVKVFPSKTIVGFAAVVALAEEGIAVRPATVSRPVSSSATAFFALNAVGAASTDDIGFPSRALLANYFNPRPFTLKL